MPLYDFACSGCGATATLLMKHGDAARCPDCGSGEMNRLLAPFAVGGRGAAPAPTTPTIGNGPKPCHTHTHAHAHAPAATACAKPAEGGSCRSDYVQSVLKKYVP